MIRYLPILATILFTVVGQLLVKAGMQQVGQLPQAVNQIGPLVFRAVTNLSVISGLVLAVLAALSWMSAVSMSHISFAYPFMALAIVLVLAFATLLFGEN